MPSAKHVSIICILFEHSTNLLTKKLTEARPLLTKSQQSERHQKCKEHRNHRQKCLAAMQTHSPQTPCQQSMDVVSLILKKKKSMQVCSVPCHTKLQLLGVFFFFFNRKARFLPISLACLIRCPVSYLSEIITGDTMKHTLAL